MAAFAAEAGAEASPRPESRATSVAALDLPPQAIAGEVALFEATTTEPIGPGVDVAAAANRSPDTEPGQWPPNVTSVAYWETDRGATARLLDETTAPDDRRVVVILLVGHFAVVTTGPPRVTGSDVALHLVTGTTELVVADAGDGSILDFKLSDAAPAGDVPFTGLYHR